MHPPGRSYTVGDPRLGSVVTMDVLSIEASRHTDELVQLLRQRLERFKGRTELSIREEHRREAILLGLQWPDRGVDDEVGREVAHALAQHIVSNLEPDLLSQLIRRHYGRFDASERAEILDSARAESPRRGLMSRLARRIGDYLLQHRTVNLDGFVTFRLKDYLLGLEHDVDAAVDEFLIDREYREFVRLLRYFVEVQSPKLAEVHVMLRPDGHFELRDALMQPLPDEVAAEFRLESQGAEINLEDVLVSSLITLAPAEVTVHGDDAAQELPSVRTAQQVFGQRLHYCTGCRACEALRRAGL